MVMAVEARFMTRVKMRYLEMRGKSRLVGGRNFSTMSTRKTISERSSEMPRVSFSCILIHWIRWVGPKSAGQQWLSFMYVVD